MSFRQVCSEELLRKAFWSFTLIISAIIRITSIEIPMIILSAEAQEW